MDDIVVVRVGRRMTVGFKRRVALILMVRMLLAVAVVAVAVSAVVMMPVTVILMVTVVVMILGGRTRQMGVNPAEALPVMVPRHLVQVGRPDDRCEGRQQQTARDG
ncbi:hypothetical protein ABI59_17185 [Acidobacteria bacterium Mor1]|nr:hypothetical protein ABI59_17185 [Acidobacteria bacterium Mor1]